MTELDIIASIELSQASLADQGYNAVRPLNSCLIFDAGGSTSHR